MNGREPFLSAAQALLDQSGCTVRKWRTNSTGVSFSRSDDWGIEVPEPRGAISFGIFAHEVGHQMLHRKNSAPRWQEEVEADSYALEQFFRFDLPGREQYEAWAARHLAYAFSKAINRARHRKVAMVERISTAYPDWWQLALSNDRWGRLTRILRELAEPAILSPEMSDERRALDAL